MTFEQGDLIEVNFNPTLGHESQKRRPALVVSVGFFNNVLSSLVVVCPITSTVNGHPLHVKLPEDCAVSGRVCIEAMRAIDLEDPACGARRLGCSLDEETMACVLDGIGGVFGI